MASITSASLWLLGLCASSLALPFLMASLASASLWLLGLCASSLALPSARRARRFWAGIATESDWIPAQNLFWRESRPETTGAL